MPGNNCFIIVQDNQRSEQRQCALVMERGVQIVPVSRVSGHRTFSNYFVVNSKKLQSNIVCNLLDQKLLNLICYFEIKELVPMMLYF